jgi:hypothetical protein
MKAFDEPRSALAEQAGPILLFDGEVTPKKSESDERSQTGILTSGLSPRSRLPGPMTSGCGSL